VLDKPNPDSDRRLAKHLVSLYNPSQESSNRANEGIVDQVIANHRLNQRKSSHHYYP
jgi:hypothetical protein